MTPYDRTFQQAPDPDATLVDVLQTTERAIVTLAAAALEQEGIDLAVEHRGLSDQILGQRSTATVGETDEPFAIVVRREDAARAQQLMDSIATEPLTLDLGEPVGGGPGPGAPPPALSTDVALFDAATGTHVGSLSNAQFDQIASHLERESNADDDYYLTPATLDLLSDSGVDPSAIAMLQHALGGRPGMDLRWLKSGEPG